MPNKKCETISAKTKPDKLWGYLQCTVTWQDAYATGNNKESDLLKVPGQKIKQPHILWDGTVFTEANLDTWHQIMKRSHYQKAPFSKVPSFTEVADLQKASFQHTMHNRPQNGHGTRPYQWYV